MSLSLHGFVLLVQIIHDAELTPVDKLCTKLDNSHSLSVGLLGDVEAEHADSHANGTADEENFPNHARTHFPSRKATWRGSI